MELILKLRLEHLIFLAWMIPDVHGDFFAAFSKTVFGDDMTLNNASYPLPENFALLLSRTHLAHQFEWDTRFSPPGKQFNSITSSLSNFLSNHFR